MIVAIARVLLATPTELLFAGTAFFAIASFVLFYSVVKWVIGL